MTRQRRQKLGLVLVYTASTLMAVGGLGDQFIHEFLRPHLEFLGHPLPAILAEGWNTFGMHSAGSSWIDPITVLVLLFCGLLLYRPNQDASGLSSPAADSPQLAR